MEYSPIQSFKIRNFRQLGAVDLNFDTPIITIVGENDAGKTSTILAFAVCGLNAYASKQKKYIKRGTNAFGLSLSLADGTTIQRIKANTQNSLQIVKGEEIMLDLSKFDNPSLQPEELEKVMGLLKDSSTGEILNIRTYNDRLIFAQTTGGDNYKIIYEMLKVSNLVRALRRGNEEASNLKKKINNNAILIEHTLGSLREIKQVNVQPLMILRETLLKKVELYRKTKQAVGLKQYIDRIHNEKLNEIQNLSTVDIEQSNKIKKAYESKQFLLSTDNKTISSVDKLSLIDTIQLNKFTTALAIIQQLQNTKIKSTDEVDELQRVDLNIISKLGQAIGKKEQLQKMKDIDLSTQTVNESTFVGLQKIKSLVSTINQFEEQEKQLQNEINEIREKITNSGVKYKICSNCGEVILLDE
jgi:uncharacterized protein (UPF0335 family)